MKKHLNSLTTFFRGMYTWGRKRPYLAGVVLVALIALGAYAYSTYGAADAPTYTIGTVESGVIESTVSASGQVASLDEITLAPKVSGDVVWVSAKAGDRVRAGQVLASIDATDATRAIKDAEQALKESRLQFEQDKAQAPFDFTAAEEDIRDAESDLKTAYADAYTALSDTYLALPAVITDAEDALYDYDLTSSQWNIDVYRSSFTDASDAARILALADSAARDYKEARTKYDASLVTFKSLSRASSAEDITAFLATAVPAATAVAASVESDINLIDAYVDLAKTYNRTIPQVVVSTQTSLRSHLSTANGELSSLLAARKSLDTAARTVRDAERALEILKIGNPTGANPISLQSSSYSIEDQERTLSELRADLADYSIVAPFAGMLASFDVRRFDTVSPGTALGVLITDERVATLSLNEVDVALVALNDAVTLTFDAVEDLTIVGRVAEISPVGTVTQGVVSYDIKIVFDASDTRVKPGMTVNATIVTERKEGVLVVPQSAVKTERRVSYVEVLDVPEGTNRVTTSEVPRRITVETGLEGDTTIEIVSGLEVGDRIIVRTNTGAAEASAGQQGFGGPPIRL